MQENPVYILGISCHYHDSAAVLLKDGKIVFAAEEERFTRKKHDASFPEHAILHALDYEGISIDQVTAIGYYEKPMLKFFDRILDTILRVWPKGFIQYQRAMQEWMGKKLWIRDEIRKKLQYKGNIFFAEHHESHAASAFFASGFDDATIVTVDGVGEWATTTIGFGHGKDLAIKKEIHFPHSLGLLYSAFTYYLGFTVNDAEYKVMGLAPYGQPVYVDKMRELVDIKDDGSFHLKMKYFTYEYGQRMTGSAIEKFFEQPRRTPESPLTQFHKDIARSLQALTEEVMMKIIRHAKIVCPSKNLCLSGGVALNCVANGKILRSGLFDDIFIQPAAGDAGGALGVALLVWHRQFGGKRIGRMEHASLGTSYSEEQIIECLEANKIPFERLQDRTLVDTVATLLEKNFIVGWFQGRMEYGPRSLGNRSILGDARKSENWQRINRKIKFRESFRPFAPTVLAEHAGEYFDLPCDSPFMLFVADVHPDKRAGIPAVTHIDGTARIQTIRRNQNPRYEDLIKTFEAKTGCPVIINTSFNVQGEPIVESPNDALKCFLDTGLDILVLGNCLIRKDAIS